MEALMKVLKLPNVVMNRWIYKLSGGEERPVFFDPAEVNQHLKLLQDNWSVIREELEGILPDQASIPEYHKLDKNQTDISKGENVQETWKVFMLYAMGKKIQKNRNRCPQTAALLDQIPYKFQAFFSILSPRKSIPAHDGPYLGYLRFHLGLKVPKSNPPRIRVHDETYTWKEGESMVFDDSWNHQVYNHCDEERVILVVDVLRPLPKLSHVFNRMFQLYARMFYAKFMLNLK